MVTALLEIEKRVSDAFRLEYTPKVNPIALRRDVESYLGEYRFRVQEYKYELLFGTSIKGESRLLAVDDREAMIEKARRAIERRDTERKNIDREEAELKGLTRLEHQLEKANVGDKIVWISPPGPESEGYGDYGFVFIGGVDQINPYTQEKHLSMTAVRVERPLIDQFNSTLTFLTGYEFKFDNEKKFLENPVVAANFWDEPENVLTYIFNLSAASDKDSLFRKIVPLLSPQINEFIDLVRQGQSKDLLYRALQTIELYALDLIKNHSHNALISPSPINVPIQQMMFYYQDRTPPAVAGSCGSTGNSPSGIQSPNIFNNFSSLNELFSLKDDYRNDPNLCHCGKPDVAHFHCPGKTEKGDDCNHTIIVGAGTTECSSCGLKATCA